MALARQAPQLTDFCRRAEALLGGRGWKARWARAMDYRPAHVTVVTNGHEAPPQSWMAALELLEKLPPDQWPLRWQR